MYSLDTQLDLQESHLRQREQEKLIDRLMTRNFLFRELQSKNVKSVFSV